MGQRGNYDRTPFVPVGPASSCDVGWPAILDRLRPLRSRKHCVLAVECYPGVDIEAVRRTLADGLLPVHLVDLRQAYKDAVEVEKMCAPYLGDDPVFGRMNGLALSDFFEPGRSAVLRGRADAVREGLVLIVGAGASLLCRPDVVVYADLARGADPRAPEAGRGREPRRPRPEERSRPAVEARLLRRLASRGPAQAPAPGPRRLAARHERQRAAEADLGRRSAPRPRRDGAPPVPGRALLRPGPGGRALAERNPRPAGGTPGSGRCFDCVPEETSLLLGFGTTRVEVPALDLVFRHARTLLGEAVHARFGVEFPIRFDILDTTGGGNLALQVDSADGVHPGPLRDAHRPRTGATTCSRPTQDARVYLGLREGIDRELMLRELRRAQEGGRFADEQYVASWPATMHDHFLIPSGTVYGAGKDCVDPRDRRGAVRVRLRAVGLRTARAQVRGAPPPRRDRPRCGQHPVGAHDSVGRAAGGEPRRPRRRRATVGVRSVRGSTSASSSRRAGIGSRKAVRTTPAAG